MGQLQLRWSIKSDRWQASTDWGQTWENLKADNVDDSSEAVDEATEEYGFARSKWDMLEV